MERTQYPSPDAEQTPDAPTSNRALPQVGMWLLLTLPVPSVLLTIYIFLKGPIKLSGVIIIGLFLALIECVVLFAYRCVNLCVAFYRRRRN